MKVELEVDLFSVMLDERGRIDEKMTLVQKGANGDERRRKKEKRREREADICVGWKDE